MQPAPGTHPHPRPRHKIDWELISCGFRGHCLTGRDAARLRPQDALIVRAQGGLRWHRCLRCDSWVALPEPSNPVREHPPDRDEIEIPLRGKALRDRFVLRLIAIDRSFHFLVLGTLGFAVLLFAAHERSLRGQFYAVMAALQRGVGGGPVQSSGHVGITGELDKLFSLRSGRLHELAAVLIAYAVLEGIEGVGLWYMKRWAEYLTFLATTLLLPLEVYEMIHKLTALKIIGFIINMLVVAWLLYAKRLFGLRGGGGADERERMRDMDWDAIERATPPAALPSS